MNYMEFAMHAHKDQKYGDQPYTDHLEAVVDILARYDFRSEKYQAAGWLHDVIEDTTVTSNEIIALFGVEVAEIVIACTGEGSNRKERVANILYKLGYCPDACIVKCADRIANCEAGGKNEMYRKEQEDFERVVRQHVPEAMWKRLEDALRVEETSK